MLQIGRTVVRSQPVSDSGFFIDTSFRSHYGSGVDSASNRNECREYFLVGKGGRCVRLTTLPPSCTVVTKSGSLNFLEHSGPVQACNGTALPLLKPCRPSRFYPPVMLKTIKQVMSRFRNSTAMFYFIATKRNVK